MRCYEMMQVQPETSAVFPFVLKFCVSMRGFASAISRLLSREAPDWAHANATLCDIDPFDVARLREENCVTRNLIMDIVENEASLCGIEMMSPAERALRFKARTARRRELFGEAVVLLDKDAAPRIAITNPVS